MDNLRKLIHFVLHIHTELAALTAQYGTTIYLILFVVIFAETGLVVTPFLPGDSLLFAAGFVANTKGSVLDVWLLGVTLTIAAILGDTLNYHIGKLIGPRVLSRGEARFLRREHLERTQLFFEKHGSKTIVLARFVPIVRTFAPFVAGAGNMHYTRFLVYNIVGAVAWVSLMMGFGVFLGDIIWVQQHFEKFVIGIVIISVLPMVFELWRSRNLKSSKKNKEAKSGSSSI